jgi:DNA-3-methyladenine glycosylase
MFNLTNGPGKFCKAFGINKKHNGVDLTGDKIYILDQPKLQRNKIGTSKRIGITRSVDLEWRFFIKDNLYLSRR